MGLRKAISFQRCSGSTVQGDTTPRKIPNVGQRRNRLEFAGIRPYISLGFLFLLFVFGWGFGPWFVYILKLPLQILLYQFEGLCQGHTVTARGV